MSHLEKLLTIQVQPMKKDMIPSSEDGGIFDFFGRTIPLQVPSIFNST
jgi:hypothetical protein